MLSGDKKENKDPKKTNHVQQSDKQIVHPNFHSNLTKPPVLTVNGSNSQELHIDIDLPAHKEKVGSTLGYFECCQTLFQSFCVEIIQVPY